jgi:protein-S-isoprenylcysteine O-methyltransferase Ste14
VTVDRAAGISNAPISRSKDLLAAIPLMLWCLFGIWGFVILIAREWRTPDQALTVASQMLGIVYLLQIIVLLWLRRPPRLRMTANSARAYVMVAANAELLLLLLPKSAPPPELATLSAILLAAGTMGSGLALYFLGRAFAIFPQARHFTKTGVYRWSRHPLYLMETVATFGLALQFVQPWGLIVAAVNLGLQFPRMKMEEWVMTAAFPGYAVYAEATPRLLPFLPRVWFNR